VGPGALLSEAHAAVESTSNGRFLTEPGLMREITRAVAKTRKSDLALELAYVARGGSISSPRAGLPPGALGPGRGVALVEAAGASSRTWRARPHPESSHLVCRAPGPGREFRARFFG